MLPLTAIFFALQIAASLLAMRFGAPHVTVSDVFAFALFACVMALVASVALPSREPLVWATGMTVERAARELASAWLGSGWQVWAMSMTAGAVALLVTRWYMGSRASSLLACSGSVSAVGDRSVHGYDSGGQE
ncbi:MAG: hypothetical protein U0Q11_10180 [Vicinamibacterales bacterium]